MHGHGDEDGAGDGVGGSLAAPTRMQNSARPAGQARFYKFTAAADTSPRKRRSCGSVAFRALKPSLLWHQIASASASAATATPPALQSPVRGGHAEGSAPTRAGDHDPAL
jgi:hypothetical protein